MNIIEYVSLPDVGFQNRPVGEVDSLVLCQLAYVDLSSCGGLALAEVYARCMDRLSEVAPVRTELNGDLLAALAHSARFGTVRVVEQRTVFDVNAACQFSATLYDLGGLHYLACRGTDGTLVGWKEDLDLMYQENIAAQQHALQWLNSLRASPLIVGGHSKGGNLALYAAAFCDPAVQDAIIAVYDHDGPGFMDTVTQRRGYADILSRVHKTVPEMCVFGHILRDNVPYRIIEADGDGVYQHLAFNWHCREDGTFVTGQGLRVGSQIVAEFCAKIVPAMTIDERRAFVTSVYDSLRFAEVCRVGEIVSFNTLKKVIVFNRSLPKDIRRKIMHCVRLFIAVSLGSSINVTEEYIADTFAEWRERREKKRADERAGILKMRDSEAVSRAIAADDAAVVAPMDPARPRKKKDDDGD